MRVLTDPTTLAAPDRGSHAAIGNFDGVHRGHREVLETARGEARRRSGPLSVVTFEPHPRSFFQPGLKPFRLTPAARKAALLRQYGVDLLFVLTFDKRLASMSAEDFAIDVLGARLGLASVAVGANFRFGHARIGDPGLLRALAPIAGYTVADVRMMGKGGASHSSSSIRAALAAGDPGEAARQLGYWHRIEGKVRRGERRGRDLGMPTANLALGEVCRPAFGVYTARVETGAGRRHDAVANIGVSPMFPGRSACLEVHLFDFAGDLYGEFLSVELVAFQRREATFNSLTDLADQMQRDAATARATLARLRADGECGATPG